MCWSGRTMEEITDWISDFIVRVRWPKPWQFVYISTTSLYLKKNTTKQKNKDIKMSYILFQLISIFISK